LHWVWFGAQMPVQTPPTQVCATPASPAQLVIGPHVPPALQVWVPLLAVHWTAPGEHWAHAPFQHTGVAPAHVVWFCQLPDESHVCTIAPEHCVCPGAHAPEQTPPMQAWFTQHAPPHAPASHPAAASMPEPVSATAVLVSSARVPSAD
jgi:hypothetical protein